MTREEARQIIATWLVSSKGAKGQCGYIEGWFDEEDAEAFRMAIEALQAEYEDYEHATLVDIKEPLKVSVVRCKDCLNYNGNGNKCNWGMKAYDDAYCSHGHYDDGSTPILNCADGERREP